MSYNIIDISNKIIASTDVVHGDLISNLKLQKLLYYCQGFSMAANSKKLFENGIEAWQYGPVVREAYFNFKDYGNGAILLNPSVPIITLEPVDEDLFKEVLDEYGQFSAIKLMNMTHDELPWKKTFAENPQAEIPENLLLEYFKTQVI